MTYAFPLKKDLKKKYILFSITCASSTTYAYLGEFHDLKHRARALMMGENFRKMSFVFNKSKHFSLNTILFDQSAASDVRIGNNKPGMEFLH